VVLSDEFDLPDDAGIECWEVFRWDPLFEYGLAADLVDLVVVEEGPPDL
jgi:hypothetical protein